MDKLYGGFTNLVNRASVADSVRVSGKPLNSLRANNTEKQVRNGPSYLFFSSSPAYLSRVEDVDLSP